MNRSEIVRAAYERFNDKDFEGVLELCDPEVEFRDLLGDDNTAHGHESLRQRWAERFAESSAHVTVGEVVEIGGTVLAAVCYQAFDPVDNAVGPYVLVTDQFTFRDDRILTVEATRFADVPDEVKAMFGPPPPPSPR